jgi:hypothetical protein
MRIRIFAVAIAASLITGADTVHADDKAFFSGAHVGMTIQDLKAYYRKFGNVGEMWHSGAPTGEREFDFRTDSVPQRRVYVDVWQSDNKIVRVMYWKLGDGEAFSAAEQSYLTNLNDGQGPVTVGIVDGSAGSEFEVTTSAVSNPTPSVTEAQEEGASADADLNRAWAALTSQQRASLREEERRWIKWNNSLPIAERNETTKERVKYIWSFVRQSATPSPTPVQVAEGTPLPTPTPMPTHQVPQSQTASATSNPITDSAKADHIQDLKNQIDSLKRRMDMMVSAAKMMGVTDPQSTVANQQLTLDRLNKELAEAEGTASPTPAPTPSETDVEKEKRLKAEHDAEWAEYDKQNAGSHYAADEDLAKLKSKRQKGTRKSISPEPLRRRIQILGGMAGQSRSTPSLKKCLAIRSLSFSISPWAMRTKRVKPLFLKTPSNFRSAEGDMTLPI